mmetsp:Transcript_3276/g.2735  ORF Transcript_3276/g.2735 Transcript_3276/m.2735 type:complete len:128 (-) Transcript_3276:28-411(-)
MPRQKKHFDGNFKNSPTKNYLLTQSQNKKIFDSEEAIAMPGSTSQNFLGKGNCTKTDVMEGYHRRKIDYRLDQAKDAINYKSWVDRPKTTHKDTVISHSQLSVYNETKTAYMRNKNMHNSGVYNRLW